MHRMMLMPGIAALAAAMTTATQPDLRAGQSSPTPKRKRRVKRGRHRYRLGRTGRVTAPQSASVKSWARYLARGGRAPIEIRDPDRYLHSHARSMSQLVKALEARRP